MEAKYSCQLVTLSPCRPFSLSPCRGSTVSCIRPCTSRDWPGHGANALLEIEFQRAVGVFVLDDHVVEGKEKALGGIKIHDDAVRQLDRLAGRGGDLWVEAE